MKKKIFIITAVLLLTLCAVSAYAVTNSLSPALEVIANETKMIKCAGNTTAVTFRSEDFTDFANFNHSAITIVSLPPESDGDLLLGGTTVKLGQTISMSNLDLLRFVPHGDINETSFRFTLDRSYTTECIIKITEKEGSVPTASGVGMSAVTQTDVTCHGILEGSDPDGDLLLFEVVDYPSNGLINLTDARTGNFTYTPYDGFEGVDSFSYRVRDELGHYSEKCEVTMKIEPREYEKVITDMEEHPSYCAVLSMVGGGYMDVIIEKGKVYFDPDETVTREDFLVTTMKALGTGNLSSVNTSFLDNDDISKENRGYVAAAYKFGIVKGDVWEGIGVNFYPDEPITRAEAAVILNRILGLNGKGTAPVFADADAIPAWAISDVAALSNTGIISQYDNIYDPVGFITRCEVADMLYNTKNYLLNSSDSNEE